jgi:hypothetical protein
VPSVKVEFAEGQLSLDQVTVVARYAAPLALGDGRVAWTKAKLCDP